MKPVGPAIYEYKLPGGMIRSIIPIKTRDGSFSQIFGAYRLLETREYVTYSEPIKSSLQ